MRNQLTDEYTRKLAEVGSECAKCVCVDYEQAQRLKAALEAFMALHSGEHGAGPEYQEAERDAFELGDEALAGYKP